MAAITSVIESLPPERPSRLVLPDDMYFGIRSLLNETNLGERFDWVAVGMNDLEALEAACALPTGIVWIETPSNPREGQKIGSPSRCPSLSLWLSGQGRKLHFPAGIVELSWPEHEDVRA